MPFDVPTPAEIATLGQRFGLTLDQSQRQGYAALIAGSAAAYDRVEQLYRQHAPAPVTGRTSSEPADNPLRAWYRRTDIVGTPGGPLTGRTVAIKDNVSVAGVPMMNGSVTVEGYVPTYDATVVTRLLGAGATITGKAVCESLCFSGGSHTADTGPVRNPWDPDRTTGGSSAGSAALVAAGEVDLALGGDQGGSIRIPSAFCGTVGHKPTFGLVPYTGAFPIERTIDHLGPITTTVADAAVMLGVLAGYDEGRDPRQPVGVAGVDYRAALEAEPTGLRVGIVAEGFGLEGLSQPELDATVRATALRLAEAGLVVEDVSVPEHADAFAVWNVIATDGATVQMIEGNAYGYNVPGWYDPELMAHYGRQWRERADRLSVTTKLVALCGARSLETNYGSVYGMAQNLVPMLRAAYDKLLSQYDVLVMPTLPIVASLTPPPDADLATSVARALEMIANTAPFDVTGHPATSVPAGMVDGLPTGLMIIGKHFDDATCLRVAQVVEQQAGGFPRPGQ
ncbi:MAG: amidase [Austwickia sp.]|nr:amidase [Austwickia sp.]